MFERLNKFTVVITLLLALPIVAQESNDQVRETVTVVKSYNPEIEPSRKEPLRPQKPNFEKSSSGKLNYTIPTFPVLDTYIPKFAAPYLHWVSPIEDRYSSLVRLSAGNYANLAVDLVHNEYVSNRFNYGINASFDHLKGDLDSNYYSPFNKNFLFGTSLDFSSSIGDGGLRLNYHNQQFNYYGLETMIGITPSDKSVSQRYNRVEGDFDYNFNKGVVQHLSVDFNSISDLSASTELSVLVNSNSSFKFNNRKLNLKGSLDYLNGGFQNASLTEKVNNVPDPYRYMNFEIKPQLEVLKEKLKLLVGVDINALSQNNGDASSVNVYPALDALYDLSNEVVLKAGLNGKTNLNSFSNLTKINPYLSPTIDVKPSFTAFDFNVGLDANSGKFLSLSLNAGYSRVNDQPLMMLNYQNYFRADTGPYLNGNLKTFQVVYDRLDQVKIGGTILIKPSDHLSINSGVNYRKYKTLNEKEAWNLPNLTAFGSLNAKLSDRWFFSGQLNYTGSRKDRYVSVVEFILPGEYPEVRYDLEAFLNVDMSLFYQYSDTWSFELKAENLTNNQYQLWYQYPDLGAKISVGAQYRFDL